MGKETKSGNTCSESCESRLGRDRMGDNQHRALCVSRYRPRFISTFRKLANWGASCWQGFIILLYSVLPNSICWNSDSFTKLKTVIESFSVEPRYHYINCNQIYSDFLIQDIRFFIGTENLFSEFRIFVTKVAIRSFSMLIVFRLSKNGWCRIIRNNVQNNAT